MPEYDTAQYLRDAKRLIFRRFLMMQQFEAVQKFGKDSFEATVKAFDVAPTGTKVIADKTADYAKKPFEQNTATFEKLVGARSLDQAIQIQSDYLKSTYEGFVAHITKSRELYTKLTQDSFAPFGFLRSAAGAAVAPTKPAARTK
jgi:hypothetical protein